MYPPELLSRLALASLALLLGAACVGKADDTADETSTDPSGDGDGDPGDAVGQACAAACEVYVGCYAESLDSCVASCVADHAQYTNEPECLAAELILTQCLAGLDCDGLAQFLAEAPEPYPCQAELDGLCGGLGGECNIDVAQGQGPGECSVAITCDGDLERAVQCDGSSCTCLLDGSPVGSCALAEQVCADPSPDGYALCCE